MSSDDIVLNGIVYERDTSGAWIDMEPAGDDGAVWVGPVLDDPQLCAALDEIERLRAELSIIASTCVGSGGEFWAGTAPMDRLPMLSALMRHHEQQSDDR